MVSADKFLAYCEVQYSGLTNMFDVDEVLKLNKKMSEVELTRKDVFYIMKNYSKLREKFGVGGVNVDIKSIR